MDQHKANIRKLIMKSPFDKAIKSFRKQIKKLSKEEIEERLNKYKIMDLTDKIDKFNISQKYTFLYKDSSHLDGIEMCLRFVTPKVAIDFAIWIATSEYENPLEINGEIYWRYFQCDGNYTSAKTL